MPLENNLEKYQTVSNNPIAQISKNQNVEKSMWNDKLKCVNIRLTGSKKKNCGDSSHPVSGSFATQIITRAMYKNITVKSSLLSSFHCNTDKILC